MSYINKNPYFPDVVKQQLEKAGLKQLEDENPQKIQYCDISYGNRNNPSFQKCEIVNQLANVDILGNKKVQYNNHLKYYKTRPNYLPMTISFSIDNIGEIQSIFLQSPREQNKKYILKPENGLARGGVGVVRNHLELIRHIGEHKHKDWILQEYIDHPLLLHGKKFHFRVYVIYIQTPEWQAAYIGKKGFMYTANKVFNPAMMENDIMLSGESSPENVFYSPEDFIAQYGKLAWDNKIFPQFVKICRETVKSALEHLQCPNNREQKCFKILGYDILIDKNMDCYLAEINARNVSYKYPNQQFKKSFYKPILKLVLASDSLNNQQLTKKRIPYERILYQQDGNVIEGFNGIIKVYDRTDVSPFNRYYLQVVLPFIFLVIVVIAFMVKK